MSYDYKTFLKPLADYLVSIPLEQGSVLRLMDELAKIAAQIGLNPFGTGQCLTTER